MCDACTLQAGVDAADALLDDIFRIPIEKALNPLQPLQFVTLIRRVARSLRDDAAPAESAAAKRAAEIVDANWPDMTVDQRDQKLAEIQALLASTSDKVLPGIEATFDASADVVVGPTRKQLVKRYDLGIEATLTKRDEETAQRLRDTEALFVRNNYGVIADKLSEKAREIVAAGLEKGLGRDDISGELAESMRIARRPDSYWSLIATTFCNRARNFTQVHAMDDAGIKAYAIEAILDEVTSEICRFLHGKQFPVVKAVKQIKSVQQLDDPQQIRDQMPWLSKGKGSDGEDVLYYKKGDRKHTVAVVDEPGEGTKDKIGEYSDAMATETLTRAGIGMPPYHGHCRTNVVPVF